MPARIERRPLTDLDLRALRPAPAGQRVELADGDVRPLRVRVTSSGRISFALYVRPKPGAAPSRRDIGTYGIVTADGTFKAGDLTLKKARDRAREWGAKFKAGIDPKDEIRLERERQEEAKRIAESQVTFRVMALDYVAQRVTGPDPEKPILRRSKEVEKQIDHFINEWGKKAAHAVSIDDVEDFLAAKAELHPVAARNLFSTLRAMFSWAGRQRKYRPLANPCHGIEARDLFGPKPERERVLDLDEIRLFWRCVQRLEEPFRAFYGLLILTGLRRDEAADAALGEIDKDAGRWEIPASRMKGKRPHVVPLTADILAIFDSMPKHEEGAFVFSTTLGKSPISGFTKIRSRLHAAMLAELRREAAKRGDNRPMQIANWHNHDLRRTFRTQLSAIPQISHDVREALLAHKRSGVHGVYDRYEFFDEKAAALKLWAARLREIVAAPLGELSKFHS